MSTAQQNTTSLYAFAGSDEGIRQINQASATMCDLEDMAKTSWTIGDMAGLRQAITGFINVWLTPLDRSKS